MSAMKLVLLALSCLLLCSCSPDPEPKVMEGEELAPSIVLAFLQALQFEDYERAKALLHERPDTLLTDLPYCHQLFFEIPSTGRKIIGTGREFYGSDWTFTVDVKLNYGGNRMKQVRFSVMPGQQPRIRGVNPLY